MLIRQGTIKDISSLLELIKELAIFEKAENEVLVTEHELKNDLLNKHYGFIIAEENDIVLGIALYFIRYSTWKGKVIYLEDIIVKEHARNRGVGQLLFSSLISIAKDFEARRICWQVLDWNEKAINFYKKFGAKTTSEWLNAYIDL